MKLLFTFLIGFTFLTVDKTIIVHHPKFARTAFLSGDSLLFAEYFSKNKRVYEEYIDYLKNIDSCNVYIIYDIGGGYNISTVVEDHRKKLLETYKRKSSESWLRVKGTQVDLLLEDRNVITFSDTARYEDPNNPIVPIIYVTRFYGLTKK